VAGQVDRVRAALAAEGRADVPVRGLLCLVNNNPGLPASGLLDVDGIGVGGLEAILRTVSSGTAFDAVGVCSLQTMLERRFAVAGGSVIPPLTSIPPDHLARPDHTARRVTAGPPPRAPRRRSVGELVRRLRWLAPVAVLGAVGFSQLDALESMSPEELREVRPALRAAAERRAGGEVRGPRVLEAPGAFRLVYRRGSRCRVVVTVDRSSPVFGAAEKGAVSLTSTGCRPRAGAATGA
jgi:hypothetical protein